MTNPALGLANCWAEPCLAISPRLVYGGREETVAALERPDFQTWLDTWYLPNNLVVSVSGNTSHSEVG